LDETAATLALELLKESRCEVRSLATRSGAVRVFVEVIEPPHRLVVCGAGHDAIPVVASAAVLGWKVIVVDDREAFLDARRFPSAAGFVRVEHGAESARAAGLDRRTFVIVMSHNYLRDKEYLRSLVGSDVAYIGMLGPRARTDRLLSELRGEGVQPSAEDLDKIHGPAGLDLGSEGPQEVAAAIVGEMLAVRNGRSGGHLRERTGPIHERTEPPRSAPR
jgi:xanthine dehydrogenase accessory factor